jgi:hypothetical protein
MDRKKTLNLNLFLVKLKAILSTFILVLFVPVGFSGVGLYFAPSGREARLTNWNFLGFSKDALLKMHNLPGMILVVLLAVHFLLNLRIYKNEIICLVRTKR